MFNEMEVDNEPVLEKIDRSVHLTKNLRIIREFHNIVNRVSDEEFLELVPVSKFRKVKWLPMFQCLKERLVEDMEQEWNGMWAEEGMWEKIEVLENQKDKFENLSITKPLWRPQTGDVSSYLRAYNVAILNTMKANLQVRAEEYESRVLRLQKSLPPKRSYLKMLQADIQSHQKKNIDLHNKINDMFSSHSILVKNLIGDTDKDDDPKAWDDLDI